MTRLSSGSRPCNFHSTIECVGLIVIVACLTLSLDLIRWVSTLLGTRYATDFSESKFDRIIAGMTTTQVDRSWVNPLKRFPGLTRRGSPKIGCTANSPLGLSYQLRRLILQDGKVIRSTKLRKMIELLIKVEWRRASEEPTRIAVKILDQDVELTRR